MEALVYIVDDEPHIRQLAALGLRDAGFQARAFAGGEGFLAALREQAPDAIVLDWMMPPPDGMALCALLREDPKTRPIPIVMLTARTDEADRVRGLEHGADDYITKPFSVKELAARIRALLRREEYLAARAQEEGAPLLRIGTIAVDEAARCAYKNGAPVPLTMKEFDLLLTLMQNCGRVLTRELLLDRVWGIDYYGDARTVDVHIRYLRQKLEDMPDKPAYIQTVRGVGYRFERGAAAGGNAL